MADRISTATPPSENDAITQKSVAEVVQWTHEGLGSRLVLPPIQRSAVWRNAQIINYWDSLLRGYPAGLMLVHQPKQGLQAQGARTTDGKYYQIRESDRQLFDGQQRLTSILLGLGEGQLKDRLKLWVDLGAVPAKDSDLKYLLRISSTGQPFSYKADAPNEKFDLDRRRKQTADWKAKNGGIFESVHAFTRAKGHDLIGAKCAVLFQDVCAVVLAQGDNAAAVLCEQHPGAIPELVEALVQALQQALRRKILFQSVDSAVIDNEAEYIRFFGRLGQGGTPLSNDELTYSIIKYHFPEVHPSISQIMNGVAGRMTSEVNLVLAAVRLAKVFAPWDANEATSKICGRPGPEFVARMKSDLSEVRAQFQRLIPAGGGGTLQELLERLRQRLAYDPMTNPAGLPVILLARLPHSLIDVLLLMESQTTRQAQSGTGASLSAFVLYWLLFVEDSDKAAYHAFVQFTRPGTTWQGFDQKLLRHFEKEGISYQLPGLDLLEGIREDIEKGTYRLRNWQERFAGLDLKNAAEAPALGVALRVLSTNRWAIQRTLLWLQREYLSQQFPNFDPTSSRDEDLPMDLDHLVPSAKFGFHWKSVKSYLAFVDEDDNFYHRRWLVGNSLGNFRWLDSSDNRRRQDGPILATDAEQHFIVTKSDGKGEPTGGNRQVADWNILIEGSAPWTQKDVTEFQKLIDLRTVAIYETLLREGGLQAFVTADHQPSIHNAA